MDLTLEQLLSRIGLWSALVAGMRKLLVILNARMRDAVAEAPQTG